MADADFSTAIQLDRKTASSTSTFGTRLIEALELQGFTDYKQQVEKVSQYLAVKYKTAEKYLLAETFPEFLNSRPRLLYELADALEVSAVWLFNGSGLCPWKMKVVKAMESMTEWEKNKYLRLCIRLLNNDAKAFRLINMHHNGQISRQQLFAAM